VEARAGWARAVAEDQPMDPARAALPLAEMAERMQETTHRARRPPADADGDEPARAAGELHLF
ncbi:MAG TPA: hypothetical protein DCF67_00890, partial [Brevundimonas sp.]|nr:hypothetical protein [Brevundimonas sp.]